MATAEDDRRQTEREEIDRTRGEETAHRPKAAQEAAEARRVQKQIARYVERALKTHDDRTLAKQLRQAGVAEGSEVWKKIWEIYRASLSRE